jgi:hypothetical protein
MAYYRVRIEVSKLNTEGFVFRDADISANAAGRCMPSTRPGLGHVDDFSELNCPVAGGRRFFSKQFGCNPQRLYFLFDSQYVLLFHSENFKRILHG